MYVLSKFLLKLVIVCEFSWCVLRHLYAKLHCFCRYQVAMDSCCSNAGCGRVFFHCPKLYIKIMVISCSLWMSWSRSVKMSLRYVAASNSQKHSEICQNYFFARFTYYKDIHMQTVQNKIRISCSLLSDDDDVGFISLQFLHEHEAIGAVNILCH